MPRPDRFGRWPVFSPACRRAMARLLRAGTLTAYRSTPAWPVGPVPGSWAWRLEREAEEMLGARHVVACANGTLALIAALRALTLRPGEVVTTSFTFSATAAAIRFAGHEPVFADIDPATFCLDPESVATVVGPRTRAILPVHLFGRRADVGKLAAFGLPVVEDACQAVGAARPLCRGVIGAISFNGAKNVPAGEAGAVLTDSRELAGRVRRFVSHGENWAEPEVGLNARLNEPTALLAWHGLKALSRRNAERRCLAAELNRGLRGDPRIRTLPSTAEHALYVFSFVLLSGIDRAAFARRLAKVGVELGEGYIRPPLHEYPAFAACRRAPLPVVTELSRSSLCLLSQVRPPASRAAMRWLARQIRAALTEAARG